MPGPNPALRPWIWTGLFVLCGAAAVYVIAFVTGIPRSEAFVSYNLERLESYAAAGLGEPKAPRRVILIGTSRFKYATLDGEEIGRLASGALGTPVRVIGIFNNGGGFEDVAPLAKTMLRTRPDAILLQVEMLAGEPFVPEWQHQIESSLRYLKWQIVGSGPWQPDAETPWEVQYDRPCENNFSKERYWFRLQFPQKIDLMGKNAVLAKDFISEAVSQGVMIILIAVPKYPRLEKYRPSVPPALESLIEKVTVSSRQVEFWRYPAQVSSDNYCDFLHMNAKGREAFSFWLSSRIVGLIKGRSVGLASEGRS